MNVQIPDIQCLPFVSPKTGVDAKGNPATLTGTIKVTASDATLLTIVQPDPTTPGDPTSGVIIPVGPLGTANVTFEDDTDGATPLVYTLTVQVVASQAVTLDPPALGTLRAVPAG
jgi:hypothetical protein